jgi:hypothetical protein
MTNKGQIHVYCHQLPWHYRYRVHILGSGHTHGHSRMLDQGLIEVMVLYEMYKV